MTRHAAPYHLTTTPVNPHTDLDAFGVHFYSPASPETAGVLLARTRTRGTHKATAAIHAEPLATHP